MLLDTVADASVRVGGTSSRLAKRAVLAEVLASAEPDEVALVATYLAGSLRQRRTGLGWASLAHLPEPAAAATLEITDVDARLESLSALAGPGSQARRQESVTQLFASATAREQEFLRALSFGELRQGASDSLVQDALALAHDVPAALVRRAAMLTGSTATAAHVLAAGGREALEAVTLRLGVPVSPMLAASAADAGAAAATVGLPAVVDVKIDGIRVQVHRWSDDDGADVVRLWTRSLDDITDRLPEVVEAVRALPVSPLVLDGEVVGRRADGTPLPFQVIASRTATSTDPEAARASVPLELVAFDALHVAGRDLLDAPLEERDAALRTAVPPEMVVERHRADTAEEVAAVFDAAVAAGWEGVVVKRPQAPWVAGRRDPGWVKVKPRHTIDLAVIGAEWGSGRRRAWLSNLHLAAREETSGELVMLGKTFKGLTDELLRWQTAELLRREVRRTRTAVLVDPPLVVEIAFDGVQRSVRYPGGVALRFARVLRYREDKTPAEVDTLERVLALAPVIDDSTDDGRTDDGAGVTGG